MSKKLPSKITEVSADLETERSGRKNTESNKTQKEQIKTNEGQSSEVFANFISKNHDQYLESLV